MNMNIFRARPQLARRGEGAPKTRDKMDGSAIRRYFLVLALLLASCAAPDTQHQIVVSTREQKLALLDRGNVLAIRPSERKTAVMLFTLFCILGLVLTFVGIFFRGPGYSFVIPYLPFFENSSEGLHFAL